MAQREGDKTMDEAYAYTPGLKVKLGTVVSKVRRLPIPGEVLMRVGDVVSYDTIVAKAQVSGDPEIVRVASLLQIDPEDFSGCMKKRVGDPVTTGEVIAGYSSFFGLAKKSVTSPTDGTVEAIYEETGQVVIRHPPLSVQLDAYIPGSVVKELPREGVVIETNAAFIQGIFGIGEETHGVLKVVVESPDMELVAEHIKPADRGAVLVGGSFVGIEALRKAIGVGVSAIIVGGVQYKDLTSLIGKEIGVAITGDEKVGVTLIITEGFGRMRMSQHTFDLLKRFEGNMASVNGATQIRAGVIRPEIAIPQQEHFEYIVGDKLAGGMRVGTSVRIIRKPHFGAIGKVVGLPVQLQRIQTGSMVRVLEVELEDSRTVVIPRANVEIIEE